MGYEKPNTAWLVERKNFDEHNRPVWYAEDETGFHWWTADAHEARHFRTEEEARDFPPFQMIASDPDISVTEHVFLTPTPENPNG